MNTTTTRTGMTTVDTDGPSATSVTLYLFTTGRSAAAGSAADAASAAVEDDVAATALVQGF